MIWHRFVSKGNVDVCGEPGFPLLEQHHQCHLDKIHEKGWKCSKKFAFSLVLKLIRNDHDEIEEAFSPSNANCVCPIEIFLFVCAGESHFDLSIYGAENFEMSLSVL